MPHAVRHLIKVPFIIIVSFVLTTLAAPAAQAEELPMSIRFSCTTPFTPDQGAAWFGVENRAENTTITLAYDNGYVTESARESGYLWRTYYDVEPQQSANSVYVEVTDSTSDELLVYQSFARSECGVRPGANHAPVADDVSGSTYKGDPLTLTLAGHDEDGDALVYSLATTPTHGTATIAGDQLTYTPDGTYVGAEVFTYAVSDGDEATDQGNVTIQVTDSMQVTPAAPTFQQVSMVTGKASVTLPASESVRYRVYTIHNPGTPEEWTENAIKTGTYAFPAGLKVRVVAEPASGSVVLTGTKEWVYRTYLIVKVASTENAVSVSNPNPVPVRLSWSGVSTVVAAKTTRVIGTTASSITWSAKSEQGEYVSNGTTAVRQVRPAGRITLDCRGAREVTRFSLNNRSSNVAVKFDFRIGGVWSGKKVVSAGSSTAVIHRGHLKPRRMVYLYAWTNHGKTHKLLAQVRVPRGC